MPVGSDFSLEVGVRVKDEATPAFQQIGRTASQTGRTVEGAGRSFSRFGDQAAQGARRSTQAVDGAARQWRTSAARAGEDAGRAGGEGISRGVTLGAGRSTQGVESAARTWRSTATRAGEDAGQAGGLGISRGVGKGADGSVTSVQSASQKWSAAAGEGGGKAGETGGSALAEKFKSKVDGIGEDLGGKLGKLGALVAGAGVSDWLMDAIGKASDLSETVSKAQSIFGDQAAAMQQWASGAAQSMGLSSSAALDAATSFGDMFRQLGDSGPVASQTSQQVVQLAADLGSFNNLDTGDVVERLSAAFRGEYDSLQAIIPNISAARVEQEALTETGKASKDALTQQEKAHATLAIVMHDGSRAMGDFERTSSGAANTAKRNAAAMDDLKAKVGSGLLSAYQALQGAMGGVISGASHLASIVGSVASAFQSLPGPLQQAIGTFALLRVAQMLLGSQITAMTGRLAVAGGAWRTYGAAQTAASVQSTNAALGMQRAATNMGAMVRVAGGGAVQMGRFGSSVAQIGQSMPWVARAQGAFVTAASGAERFGRSAGTVRAAGSVLKSSVGGLVGMMGGPLGLAFAGAGVAAALWGKHQEEDAQKVAAHKQQVQELSGVIQQYGSVQNDAGKESVFKGLQDSGAVKAAHDLGISVTDLTSAAMQNKPAMDRVNKAIEENGMQARFSGAMAEKAGDGGQVMTDSAKKVKGAIDGSNKAIQEGTQSAKDHADAMKANAGAAGQAKQSQEELKKAQEEAAKALKDTIDSYKQLNSVLLQQRNNSRGYQASIDALSDSMKKNGKTLDQTTAAGRENGENLDGLAQKTGAFASSQYALHQNAAEANAILQDGKKRYLEAAEAMRMPRDQAEKLADDLFQVRDAAGKPIDIKATTNGLDAVHAQLNAAGQMVLKLDGSKIEIPADVVHGPQVLQMMAAIKDLRLSEDGKTLTISAKALGDKETKAAIESIPGIVHHKDGSVTIDTKALNAESTRAAIAKIKDVAVTADGRVITIPASTNAPAIKQLVEQLNATAVSTNGKSVTISTSAPLAPDTKKKIDAIRGAQVSADGKSVVISSSAPNSGATIAQIQAVLAAAKDKSVTITTRHVNVVETYTKAASSIADAVKAASSARGNVFEHGEAKAFARGGVEDHRPQIAVPRAGKVRVWAEPETEGEAYIPFADDSRRPRAKKITEMVAAKFGGHVSWLADGGIDGDWSPDMSGIMSLLSSMRSDPSAISDTRNKVKDQTSALSKATRDLNAARAKLAGLSRKATHAQRIAAENAVATAIERQAKASRDLTGSKQKLAGLEQSAKLDTTGLFLKSTGQQNGLTKRFLDNIDRIRSRGFPRLAASLLSQGDQDAQYIAQTLSGGALAKLQQADKGLAESDALADRKKQMTDLLSGVTSGQLTASAQQQANAQLIAMRGANTAMAFTGGAVKHSVQVDIDYAKLAQHLGPQIAVTAPSHVSVEMDRRVIGTSVTDYQRTQSTMGSAIPSMR